MQQRLDYLLHRFIGNVITEEELIEFNQLLESDRYEDNVKEIMDKIYAADLLNNQTSSADYFSMAVTKKMLQNIFKPESGVGHNNPGIHLKLWTKRLIAAAIALIIISFGIWLNNHFQESKKTSFPTAKGIHPGTSGAILTLADGRKISLGSRSAGKVVQEAGVTISKDSSGMLIYAVQQQSLPKNSTNLLATSNGETFAVILPDKSKVWLNAASTLKYVTDMASQERRIVELSGEGYFEITKDKKHPFIVKTAMQTIEVLGTHFNVYAYGDEQVTKTTLIEGAVSVALKKSTALQGSNASVRLSPGKEAINDGKRILVQPADLEAAISWKDGYFRFNDNDITDIMKKISRWYNIDVVYDGEIPSQGFTGTISKKSDISQVLAMLEGTKIVHFKIEGRRVTVLN